MYIMDLIRVFFELLQKNKGRVFIYLFQYAAENMFRRHQKAHNIFSIDIQRGRDFQLRTYNEYRKRCGMHGAKSFEDLKAYMDKEVN